MSEERDAIEDIYEPFLIQIGFLDRTPRGRVATAARVRVLRPARPRKGSSVVDAEGPHAFDGVGREDRRPLDLRAAARADQRGSREAGRDERRVDPAAHRHPRAAHRRPGVATSDLAKEAALGAIAQAGITPTDIGFIVVGTTTPDTIFPSTACVLQDKIGATRPWGFDLGAACSGFTYALTTGMQMVATGAHDHALVVGADVMSSIIDYTDRTTCVLFGDGAGAVVLVAGGRRRAGDHRLRRTRSTAAAVRRCACRPAAAGCRRRTRPWTSGCTTSSRTGRRCSSSRSARPRRSARRLLERNGHRPVGDRPVRVAPGQPADHQGRRRAARAARVEGRHQPREVRQHDRARRSRSRWRTRWRTGG